MPPMLRLQSGQAALPQPVGANAKHIGQKRSVFELAVAQPLFLDQGTAHAHMFSSGREGLKHCRLWVCSTP